MNRYSIALLFCTLTLSTLARADALDGLFDNSIVSSISQAIKEAYNPDDSRHQNDDDRRCE